MFLEANRVTKPVGLGTCEETKTAGENEENGEDVSYTFVLFRVDGF